VLLTTCHLLWVIRASIVTLFGNLHEISKAQSSPTVRCQPLPGWVGTGKVIASCREKDYSYINWVMMQRSGEIDAPYGKDTGDRRRV
jgi:hypothetical protein